MAFGSASLKHTKSAYHIDGWHTNFFSKQTNINSVFTHVACLTDSIALFYLLFLYASTRFWFSLIGFWGGFLWLSSFEKCSVHRITNRSNVCIWVQQKSFHRFCMNSYELTMEKSGFWFMWERLDDKVGKSHSCNELCTFYSAQLFLMLLIFRIWYTNSSM